MRFIGIHCRRKSRHKPERHSTYRQPDSVQANAATSFSEEKAMKIGIKKYFVKPVDSKDMVKTARSG